ncbi:Ndg [Drosophila busckii]|uniref:Ndg n=1 Tax=Drosophila busckii TaxID=30019 RepID=A0A0M4E7P9_DROBS|nr:Ndg [Drosophila busckii]
MKAINQNKLSLVWAVIGLLIGLAGAQYEHHLDSLRANELYEFVEGTGSLQYLAKGDSEQALLQLEQPVNFYGEKYEQIYINTNGILTFNVEFPEYLNQPFPLEYPSVAAFYSNVDTSNSNDDSSISLFVTRDAATLEKAQQLVRYAYADQTEFVAQQLIVASWRNVGYFNSKTDKLNTFQVALIADAQQTFVQFIYPDGGLNWLQGEAGEFGLPDIRAQAGFVAEDGRYYNLNGSGSENARFLSESTNLGVPGVWLYQVAQIQPGENVVLPNNAETRTESPALAQSCSGNGHQCDRHAQCYDKAEGYCCVCESGYYGNGRSCLANDLPMRVTGTLQGQLNNLPVDERAKLQSYVVTTDTRSYTTINPVQEEQAGLLRVVLPLLTTVGWLFAKPVKGAANGYQLTGGRYEHFSRIQYDSGEVLLVNQTFEGLNYWDQLSVKIQLYGEVPQVSPRVTLHLPDYTDEYRFRCSPDADCFEGRCSCREGFTGDGYNCQHICGHDEVWEHGRCVPILLDEHELEPRCNILGDCTCPEGYDLSEDGRSCRYAGGYEMDNNEELVPCDVDANCHINARCSWFEHKLRHICNCNPGYSGDGYSCELIEDSCAIKPDICDAHATCDFNDALGKSECVCARGYTGDGYRCQLAPECESAEQCGEQAFCDAGVCLCQEGYERDLSDRCVPAGRCGAVYCGSNAMCKWDAEQAVQYCQCIDGYQGDALAGCVSRPTPCNVRNNCGIHAACEPTEDPANYSCQCIAGYRGDGYVCVEEQNCLNNPTLCDMNASCHSTNNGLVCVCNQGFYGNGSVCFERQQHDSGFLIVSQGVVIVRVPLNGRNVQPIKVASMAIGLDKDCVEGRVYWGDISAKKILSANKKLESVDSAGVRQQALQTPFFGSHKMYGMTSVEQHCPQYQSLCQINNGGCTDSRLCLVNRKAPSGKSCKCTSASSSCAVATPYALPEPVARE